MMAPSHCVKRKATSSPLKSRPLARRTRRERMYIRMPAHIPNTMKSTPAIANIDLYSLFTSERKDVWKYVVAGSREATGY